MVKSRFKENIPESEIAGCFFCFVLFLVSFFFFFFGFKDVYVGTLLALIVSQLSQKQPRSVFLNCGYTEKNDRINLYPAKGTMC